MNALSVKNISKTINKKNILNNVNFSLEEGTITGFIGHNGAGKSTTFKIIMNLIHPNSGQILIWDEKPEDHDIYKKVGYIPESPLYPDYLNAKEFLSYMCDLLNIPSAKKSSLVKDAILQVGIEKHTSKLIKYYSKGMKQKLGIAQMLLAQPSLLIMDEPLSGLDPIGRHDILKIMDDLKSENKTILFSSHILYDIEKICSRYVMIADGTIIGDIPANQTNNIEELYLSKIRKDS
ncbi:MAG TPA: hypothetical protein DCS13_08055 [Candidatus Margulisbacteria bacterium]|nr:MAG: hypothetical protein A2X43_04385 [Candidatus Margulisbacteria bacterium GWD2_39_127]HAR63400.1 hypothetical protein [Candidatus Margulisiibacteriota bacterium]